MKISIITPAYNGARHLATTIDSVLNQTFTDFEYVIVDDGSADNTFEIAKRYADCDPRVRVFRKEAGGVATARNFGFAKADPSSELLTFLDHDDTWKPGALQCLFDALSATPGAVAVHGLTRMTDMAGKPIGEGDGTVMSWHRRKVVGSRIVASDRTEPTTFAHFICDCCIPTPGVVLVRRDACEAVRTADGILFDQAVASGDDWDLWLRLSLRGNFTFVDKILLDWRQHAGNASKNECVTFAAQSKVRIKINAMPGLSAEQRRMATWRHRRIYASAERRNARECWRWTWERAGQRDWASALQLARVWAQIYAHYLGSRFAWSQERQHLPIPGRLVDVCQVLGGRR
jgi:glycosyltransferase involved in cell wall biosynthesis